MTSPLKLLLEQVEDPKLRSQLTERFAELERGRSFGLTFEEHADEAVRIPGARVTRKTTVQPVSEPGPRVYSVRRITDGIATIVRASEDPREVPVADLVVARKLGDPVYMGLTPTGEIRRGGDKPAHMIIEGENYHALQTLLYTHEAKVDVIYIDPPYNTGAGDWIYNDRYVGDTDAYRHSKWLSFMDKRLRLAKRLLTPTGVIIVAIDDNEHHRLRVLMDDVFGEKNFIGNIVWQGRGSYIAGHHAGGVDYMLVYGRHAAAVPKFKDPKPYAPEMVALVRQAIEAGKSPGEAQVELRTFIRTHDVGGVKSYNRVDSSGRIFSTADLSNSLYRPNLIYPVTDPSTGVTYDPPANGWAVSEQRMLDDIAAGSVAFGEGGVRRKMFLEDFMSEMPLPTFKSERKRGSDHLKNVLVAKDFPFPKDVDVVARWVNMVAPKNAVVLDFFGGTGTTAEAVMRLNAQDGGTRQAVIVTSNEVSKKTATELSKAGASPGDDVWEMEGVYQKVTRPRLETVVTGTRRDGSRLTEPVFDDKGKKVASGIPGATGYDENIIFAKLSYLDRTDVELGRQFQEIAPLLYMQSGAIGDIIAEKPATFTLTSQYTVLADTDHRREFADAVNEAGVAHAYIVTDDAAQFQGVAAMLNPSITVHHLAEDYLVNFAINTGDVL